LCGQTKNYGLSLSSEPRSAKESTGKRIGWGTSRGCSCKKSNRERSRYPFPAEFGLAASPMLSTSPWRGQERRRDGKLRAWRTGLNELKGKLESGLSDNDAQLPAVREGDQRRIRTGRTMVTARVRAVANRNQESVVRPGNLPSSRTGRASVEVRVRRKRTGVWDPG
jgi:hypothetical protein